jgi:hypothetical protein
MKRIRAAASPRLASLPQESHSQVTLLLVSLLLVVVLLAAGCATGEVPPLYDSAAGDHTHQLDGKSGADAPGDAATSTDIREGDTAPTDAAGDAGDAGDAAEDATPCHQGCDDKIPCTDDLCLEAGVCSNPVKTGQCLIDSVCYKDGDKQTLGGCNTCDSSSSATSWTGDATLCADDGLVCTSSVCKAGGCTNELSKGYCLVSGACIADGAAASANSCQVCDTSKSTSALQNKADGSACAADTLSCTDDVCSKGACTHTLKAGNCLIGGTCYASGAKHPTASCLGCVPATATGSWSTLADGTSCASDGYWCTSDTCKGGSCTHVTQSTACLIGGQCYNSGAKNPTNDCVACNPSASSSSWTALADGTGCQADSFSCTGDACQSGLCAHPVQSGHCLVGGACYTSGQVNPSGACSFCKATASQTSWTPITYQGCCQADVVWYCENSALKSLDCSGNPSCGWDAGYAFYDCGTSGAAEPTGTFPKSCL